MTLRLVVTLCWFFQIALSQTDVSSFGIITSFDSSPGVGGAIYLILSWNTEQWRCNITQTIIESHQYHSCTSGEVDPNATLITDSLATNTYEMRVEFIENGINDLLRIEKIRVVDDDSNYYDIDTFCLPAQFQHTKAKGTILNKAECCYWSQRYSYNNFAMGTNAILKVSYAQFRSNVLNYPNEGHEGAIKPPIIKQMSINTLGIKDAGSLATYSLELHWDTQQYVWNDLIPSQLNTTYTKVFSDRGTSCEFSSGFSLKISASIDDSIGIETVSIMDETGYIYNIDMFCNSNRINQWQFYGDSGQKCDNYWSDYSMFDGLIYNDKDPAYIILDERIFSNVNTPQQAFVLNDDFLSNYICTSNRAQLTQATIYRDDMDDLSSPKQFIGIYKQSLQATNCPGGSSDNCARLAGRESGPSSEMIITINVSQYANIKVQFDFTFSKMAGYRLYFYYRFDNNGYTLHQTIQSNGDSFQPFLNQTFIPPDHIPDGYQNLSLRFRSNAAYDNQYIYIDHVYVFGDYLIEYDDCTAQDSSWTLPGYVKFTTNTYCPGGSTTKCLFLMNGQYATKQFDNINLYNNLVLSYDMTTRYICYIYYRYDSEPFVRLATHYGQASTPEAFMNQTLQISDATICGATTLYIRVDDHSFNCSISNMRLWGNVLKAAQPTPSPTSVPTNKPTTSSNESTLIPSENQITYSSLFPTHNPIIIGSSTSTTSTPSQSTIDATYNPSSTLQSLPTASPSESESTAKHSNTILGLHYDVQLALIIAITLIIALLILSCMICYVAKQCSKRSRYQFVHQQSVGHSAGITGFPEGMDTNKQIVQRSISEQQLMGINLQKQQQQKKELKPIPGNNVMMMSHEHQALVGNIGNSNEMQFNPLPPEPAQPLDIGSIDGPGSDRLINKSISGSDEMYQNESTNSQNH